MSQLEEKNWIKEQIDNRNISIKELAEILNLSERTVRGYYKGWTKPGKKVKLNLLKILDMEE